jgi:hypothetical protein
MCDALHARQYPPRESEADRYRRMYEAMCAVRSPSLLP